ncbi:c-type cytochrome [Peristeroidobacter agariperforans]|uniref:c-type cytochrome n=1 Tax=Peristeroidobacter agariperforans TaxID=268404 RepID=UPI00101DE404|nr:c-type cytochrome [Peristeroidobacter agariperforans]
MATHSRMPVLRLVVASALIAVLAGGTAVASPESVDEKVRNALQLDQNTERGATLYAKHCAECHGPRALGSASRVIPALAGQRRAYLVKQLTDFSELERASREMHSVVAKPELGNEQAWADLAGFLNSLPRASFPQTGDGRDLELGEAIFQEQCASCHQDDGRGDDDGFIPSVRDQHYSYLVRQMRTIASWHRLNVDADLVRYLDSLDTDEATAVADYLSRMRGPIQDHDRMNSDGTTNN